MNNNPRTFTVGGHAVATFPTDHTLRIRFEVVKRTAKFVTLVNTRDDETVRVSIKDAGADEWALPFGTFSMAPVARPEEVDA